MKAESKKSEIFAVWQHLRLPFFAMPSSGNPFQSLEAVQSSM